MVPCYSQPLSWKAIAQRPRLGGISGAQLVWLPTQQRLAQSVLLLTVQSIYHITISYCPHQYCIQVMSDPVCQDYSGFLRCLQITCKSSPLGTSCRFNGCCVHASHQLKCQIDERLFPRKEPLCTFPFSVQTPVIQGHFIHLAALLCLLKRSCSFLPDSHFC